MNELLQALTRAANAVADYYEKQANPLRSVPEETARRTNVDAIMGIAGVQPTPAEPVKTRKPRAPKAETAAPAPAATPVVELTEDQSVKEVGNYAKLLIQRYPKPVLNGVVDRDNNPFPEGYHLARKILAEGFKVGKMADLVHPQRLQFIAKVKSLIAEADAQPATAPSNDPAGIGV